MTDISRKKRRLIKKRKRKMREKPPKIQQAVVIIFRFLFVAYFAILPFLYNYIQREYLIHYKSELLIFVFTSVMIASIPSAFIGAFVSLGYFTYFQFEKFVLWKNWKGLCVFLVLSIFLATVPFIFIKNRYDITENGIYKYSNSGLVQKIYSWQDISEVNVKIFPPGFKSGYELRYRIVLNNEKDLELIVNGYSKNFWRNLYSIDDILRKHNVTIHRDNSYLNNLDENFRDTISPLLD